MTHMNGSVAIKIFLQHGYKGLVIGVTGSVLQEDIHAGVVLCCRSQPRVAEAICGGRFYQAFEVALIKASLQFLARTESCDIIYTYYIASYIVADTRRHMMYVYD